MRNREIGHTSICRFQLTRETEASSWESGQRAKADEGPDQVASRPASQHRVGIM